MQKMKVFYDCIYRITMVICKLLLIADILITSMSILGRYVSFIPYPSWSEEIVLTLMSYMAVLSAALAIRRKAHIRMTTIDKYLPAKAVHILDLISDIAVLALAFVMLIYGWQYVQSTKGFYPSIPTLTIKYKFYPIPLAGLIMIIFEIEQIVNDILLLGGKEADA